MPAQNKMDSQELVEKTGRLVNQRFFGEFAFGLLDDGTDFQIKSFQALKEYHSLNPGCLLTIWGYIRLREKQSDLLLVEELRFLGN